MSQSEVFADPLFQSLLSAYEKAASAHRRSIVELRAYHLKHTPAAADKWRSAVLAQAAEDAMRRVEDALHDLSDYAWRLTPFSDCPRHLANIEAERSYHRQRLDGGGWGPGPRYLEGPEERVGPFTVILKPEEVTPETPSPGPSPEDVSPASS